MKKNQGFLSIVLVIFIVIITMLGVAAAYLLVVSGSASLNTVSSYNALYFAESGIQRAIRELLNPSLTGAAARSACTGYSMTDATTFLTPPGEFSAVQNGSLVYVTPPATLSSLISSSQTTIAVSSVAGYASVGRLMIDREVMDYTGISGNAFIGVQRGQDGTTAANHAAGAVVGQFQCNIKAQGGMPTLASPQGLTTLYAGLQMQEGWAVGDRESTSLATLWHWNRPAELAWSSANMAVASAQHLNAISAISYVDAWAVGNATGGNIFTLHWNGSTWSKVISPTPLNKNLNAIACVAGNDCWAVGQTGGIFARYDGTSWSSVVTPGIPSTTYRAVFCNHGNDCWAVAGSNTFAHFTGGTGWGWNATVTALPNATYNGLWCNATNDCWVVGQKNSSQDLIGHWNGSTWTRNSSTPLTPVNLNAVHCTSANDCWAVGENSGTNAVLVHWNGTAWTTTLVNTGVSNVALYAVDCFNENDCWAVGNKGAKLHWDGNAWSVVTVPSSSLEALHGIALVGSAHRPQTFWQN